MARWIRARARARRRPRPHARGRVGQNSTPPPDGTCISARQKQLHVTTEALAVFVSTPWLLSLVLRKNPRITTGDKLFAFGFALATLLVDGGLLLKWRRKRQQRCETNNAVGALAPAGGFIDTTARVSYAGARA